MDAIQAALTAPHVTYHISTQNVTIPNRTTPCDNTTNLTTPFVSKPNLTTPKVISHSVGD